jgi:uracil-DNA glycosylase
VDVVGKKIKARFHGHEVEVIALPHPSGVSTWPQTEPGKTKLRQALSLLEKSLPELWE